MKNCGKEFGMHDGVGSILPLDNELKALHDEFLWVKG